MFHEAALLPTVAPLMREVFATTVARVADATYGPRTVPEDQPSNGDSRAEGEHHQRPRADRLLQREIEELSSRGYIIARDRSFSESGAGAVLRVSLGRENFAGVPALFVVLPAGYPLQQRALVPRQMPGYGEFDVGTELLFVPWFVSLLVATVRVARQPERHAVMLALTSFRKHRRFNSNFEKHHCQVASARQHWHRRLSDPGRAGATLATCHRRSHLRRPTLGNAPHHHRHCGARGCSCLNLAAVLEPFSPLWIARRSVTASVHYRGQCAAAAANNSLLPGPTPFLLKTTQCIALHVTYPWYPRGASGR